MFIIHGEIFREGGVMKFIVWYNNSFLSWKAQDAIDDTFCGKYLTLHPHTSIFHHKASGCKLQHYLHPLFFSLVHLDNRTLQ